MQRLYYDLHIHSCLSPCAEDEMTPANICGMAHLKGLDAIAVTDHNSALNLRAAARWAGHYGLILVPGMEICTREEVHILAYFDAVETAEQMGRLCRTHLPPMRNRPDFFGRQLIVNGEDEVTGEEDALLIGALNLSFSEVCDAVRSLNGVPVPAHIFRGNGVVQMLGFVPKEAGITAVEADDAGSVPEGCLRLCSSDAHRLSAIHERQFFLETERSARGVLNYLVDH